MKTVWIGCIMILLAPLPSHGMDAEEWGLVGSYTALYWMDWKQTRLAMSQQDRYRELNPLLGSAPSGAEVDRFMLTSWVVIMGAVAMMPSEWRKRGLWFAVGVETATVMRNHWEGLNIGLIRGF